MLVTLLLATLLQLSRAYEFDESVDYDNTNKYLKLEVLLDCEISNNVAQFEKMDVCTAAESGSTKRQVRAIGEELYVYNLFFDDAECADVTEFEKLQLLDSCDGNVNSTLVDYFDAEADVLENQFIEIVYSSLETCADEGTDRMPPGCWFGLRYSQLTIEGAVFVAVENFSDFECEGDILTASLYPVDVCSLGIDEFVLASVKSVEKYDPDDGTTDVDAAGKYLRTSRFSDEECTDHADDTYSLLESCNDGIMLFVRKDGDGNQFVYRVVHADAFCLMPDEHTKTAVPFTCDEDFQTGEIVDGLLGEPVEHEFVVKYDCFECVDFDYPVVTVQKFDKGTTQFRRAGETEYFYELYYEGDVLLLAYGYKTLVWLEETKMIKGADYVNSKGKYIHITRFTDGECAEEQADYEQIYAADSIVAIDSGPCIIEFLVQLTDGKQAIIEALSEEVFSAYNEAEEYYVRYVIGECMDGMQASVVESSVTVGKMVMREDKCRENWEFYESLYYFGADACVNDLYFSSMKVRLVEDAAVLFTYTESDCAGDATETAVAFDECMEFEDVMFKGMFQFTEEVKPEPECTIENCVGEMQCDEEGNPASCSDCGEFHWNVETKTCEECVLPHCVEAVCGAEQKCLVCAEGYTAAEGVCVENEEESAGVRHLTVAVLLVVLMMV